MSDTKGIVSLKSIVANVMSDLGEAADMGNYARYLQWAIRGVKDAHLFHMGHVKTAELTMTSINTVNLPDDFVSFVMIGIPYKGRLWTSTRDNNLLVPSDMLCGEDVLDSVDGEDTEIGTGTVTRMFGRQGGVNSEYYKLDLPNNRIIINGLDRATAILKYKSTGVALNKNTYIPREAEESIIAYVHVQRTKFDKTATRGERADAKQDWQQATTKLTRLQDINIDDFYDAVLRSFTLAPKR